MKKFFLLTALVFLSASAHGADQASNVNYDQVREDYKTYLRELKRLGGEYNKFTGEMKKVMQEEGFPTWDEEKGIGVAPPGTPIGGPTLLTGSDYRIEDEGKHMKIGLDLPGLKKNSIQVKIQGDKFLRVSGTRKIEDRPVERLIELPFPAEQKDARATYEDGVLTVTLKKSVPPTQETSIPVR